MKKSKLFQSALSLMLVGGMLTACGSSASSTAASTAASTGSNSTAASTASDSAAPAATKQYVIGIAEAQANDEVTTRRAYLEDFIAPTYNVKFIFSETLKDDAATKTFIENCIDSGADAIIDMKSASGQMAQLCMDNGLVYTINGNYTQHPELLTTDYTNFAGCIGANNAQVGSLFGDWLEENASEDGSEGFLISTSLAAQGNTQHVEITRAILEGLQQKYGITYTKSIDDLIASSETTNVENDKNILITLYPGSPNKDTWLPGISTLLQTGNYKMFLSSGQTYNQSATVVDEVEKSFGINIKVASVGALGTTLETAFNTKDSSGNSSVDLVAIKAVSTQTAAMFAATYNALVSGAECRACRGEDGLPVYFTFNFIPITSAEQLTEMSGWDAKETGSWIANKDFIDQMLVTVNPDVTSDDINAIMQSLSYVFGAVTRKLPHDEANFDMERYITVVVLFCASGFGIYGVLVGGMSGSPAVLQSKAVLDLCTAAVFAVTLGVAVAVIALPMLAVMLALFFAAGAIAPFVTPEMLQDFISCGGVLTIVAGMRVSGIKQYPIANMIPALLLVLPASAIWQTLMV